MIRSHPSFCVHKTDDLDLHVVTPGGFHLSFIEKQDSVSKGELDYDDVPTSFGLHVEHVYFPLDDTAPVGDFTYFVQNFHPQDDPDDWTLKVFVDDSLVDEYSGITVGALGVSESYRFSFE
jgi:hypothetical protein